MKVVQNHDPAPERKPFDPVMIEKILKKNPGRTMRETFNQISLLNSA